MKPATLTIAIAALVMGQNVSAGTGRPAAANAAPSMQIISEDSTVWRRDPFLGSSRKQGPTTAPAAAGHTLTDSSVRAEAINLQGILRSDKHYLALISGRIVKAGDHIGSVTITQISRYQVVLVNENKEQSIYDIYQGRIDRGKR